MFRALSSRRSRRGYEQLGGGDEAAAEAPVVAELSRAKSLSYSKKKNITSTHASDSDHQQQIKKASKVHPFFSLFETKRKKNGTAKPEFSRYLEYVKEGGGLWDMKSNKPVIYYN
ncbi:hypothetical protein ACP275_08G259100 [Erythranthe tilingii]